MGDEDAFAQRVSKQRRAGDSGPCEPISRKLIADVCARLADGQPVHETLPDGGQLNIERLLPFLCIYRRNPLRTDAGTRMFVNAEAAFLNAPGDAPVRRGLSLLVRRIAETVANRLNGFLILEIWSAEDSCVPRDVDELTGEPRLPRAAFRILTRRPHQPQGTTAALEYALQGQRVHGQPASVAIELNAANHPPGMSELISLSAARRINCRVLGLEILPIYRDARSGEVYSDVLRVLRRGVNRALKKAFFRYTLNQTSLRPQHFFSLGRSSLPKQVWKIDRQLADVSSQFKFLLQITPLNMERAWHEFQASGFDRPPAFDYRPLETNPLLLKRRLMSIATEGVEDPTLAFLFEQTQDELDRQITMLADVGTRRFLPGSLQVFGPVEPSLLELAGEILRRCPPSRDEAGGEVDAKTFVRRAAREIRWYRQQFPSFTAEALLRDDMYSGLLSTGGNLLVGRETTIQASRVEALLQHEIGTHLVTYYNGQAQPMRLLRVGLAGYDGLQEGLAVLSEYLVGGLSPGRLRMLAARVIAAEHVVRGATFVETYRRLTGEYEFPSRVAYTVTARAYRGGGLTKDAVYLRGLVEIVDYLRRGGNLEVLLVGKIAADHVPVVRELTARGVLMAPPLRPRYMQDPRIPARLETVKQINSVVDLLDAGDNG
jgi:uncharacterized protein (TIGR02421 family)